MGSALAEAFVRAGFEVYAVDPLVSGENFSLKGVIVEPNLLMMVKAMVTPRRILLMVTAGDPVDSVIEELVPHLDAGDIIIDGGNSKFTDTIRRATRAKNLGLTSSPLSFLYSQCEAMPQFARRSISTVLI